MSRPAIALSGGLRLRGPASVELRCHGDVVFLDWPDFGSLRATLRSLGLRRSRTGLLASTADLLRATGLRAELSIAGRPFAGLGRGVDAGPLSGWFLPDGVRV